MEQRTLGRSGLKVSALGLGCNNFGITLDAAATQAVVDKAIDLGISLFDTADTYGNSGKSEEFLGRALGARRSQVLVATKFGARMGDSARLQGGGSRDTVMRAVEASLKRLGTDYIDLYQFHFPDPNTPVDETLRALDDLVCQGKVRYIGHSNFSGGQIAHAAHVAKAANQAPFISAQNRYSVLSRIIEAEVIPACRQFGLGILPYFPLESGLLSGKYKQGEKPAADSRFATWTEKRPAIAAPLFTDDKFKHTEKLQAWCATNGYNILDVAFGWLLANPQVSSVIAGATKPAQLESNAKALSWRPTAEDQKQIDAISPPPPLSSGFVF